MNWIGFNELDRCCWVLCVLHSVSCIRTRLFDGGLSCDCVIDSCVVVVTRV